MSFLTNATGICPKLRVFTSMHGVRYEFCKRKPTLSSLPLFSDDFLYV